MSRIEQIRADYTPAKRSHSMSDISVISDINFLLSLLDKRTEALREIVPLTEDCGCEAIGSHACSNPEIASIARAALGEEG